MKTTALFLFLFSCCLLHADDALKNPDFVDGISHWEGDGESASAADAIQTTPGLVIKLNKEHWTKVSQTFRPLNPSGVLTVVFRCSDDLAFSTDDSEYRKIPDKIGYPAYKKFRIPVGSWMAGLAKPGEMSVYTFTPQAGTDVQTIKTPVSGLVARIDNILCLAFPPGQGEITLLHVGITDQ